MEKKKHILYLLYLPLLLILNINAIFHATTISPQWAFQKTQPKKPHTHLQEKPKNFLCRGHTLNQATERSSQSNMVTKKKNILPLLDLNVLTTSHTTHNNHMNTNSIENENTWPLFDLQKTKSLKELLTITAMTTIPSTTQHFPQRDHINPVKKDNFCPQVFDSLEKTNQQQFQIHQPQPIRQLTELLERYSPSKNESPSLVSTE